MSAKIIPFPNANERFFQNKKKHLSDNQFTDYLLHDYIYTELLAETVVLPTFPFREDEEC